MEKGFEIFEFQHFRFLNIGKFGSAGVTVAICRNPRKLHAYRHQVSVPMGVAVAAVAFCDPGEHCFSRKEGRKQAVGKLTSPLKWQRHVNGVKQDSRIKMATEALKLSRKPWWYQQAVARNQLEVDPEKVVGFTSDGQVAVKD